MLHVIADSVGAIEILGLIFAGTATRDRAAMARFVGEVLGLPRVDLGGVDVDRFVLPDGAQFAVADPRGGGGETSRTIGFRVADVDVAAAELRAAGVDVSDPMSNDRQRYAHFHAPDGKLYELVQEL